jgi:hypothetical protein
MTPHQPQPIDAAASETAEFEALQAAERPVRDAEPAHGRPSWDPEEGDFS